MKEISLEMKTAEHLIIIIAAMNLGTNYFLKLLGLSKTESQLLNLFLNAKKTQRKRMKTIETTFVLSTFWPPQVLFFHYLNIIKTPSEQRLILPHDWKVKRSVGNEMIGKPDDQAPTCHHYSCKRWDKGFIILTRGKLCTLLEKITTSTEFPKISF